MTPRIGPVSIQLTDFLDKNQHHQFFGRIFDVPNGMEKSAIEFFSNERQIFPFIMGTETISQLKNKSALELLEFIGYDQDYIFKKLNENVTYYLVLFTGFDLSTAEGLSDPSLLTKDPLLATWDNVLKLIDAKNPNIGSRVRAVFDEIKKTKYHEYEIDIENPDTDLFHQVNSFESFSKTQYTSPTMVRCFLRHTMKLTKLYSGDGYTYNDDGIRGSKEYLIPRIKLSSLLNKSPLFELTKDLEEI